MSTGPRVIGHIWETPVIVRGNTWLPATQIGAFLAMFWYGKQRSPERPLHHQVILAGMSSSVMLGSEWAHNLSHLVIAHKIGKPMDEFHILFGMPRCIYYELDDPNVLPRQHIQRSLGGPLLNASVLPLLLRLRQQSKPGSLAYELWHAAVSMNLFLATVSFLPIPGIDGGPIVKWILVKEGYTPHEADRAVQRVNGPLAVLLGISALISWAKKKRFYALLFGILSGSALGVYMGWIKESEILQSTYHRR
jgi:Zn-dependent protease